MTHPQNTTPANPAQGVSALRDALVKALDGHTRFSRDCSLSGEYLADQIWPIVSAAIGAGGQAVARENVAYFTHDAWGGYWQTVKDGKPYNFRIGPHPAPSGQAVDVPTVNELFANCDRWGALEWFNRLAMAIRNRDKAVVEGNDMSFATYDNIAKSSAARLVHDFEQEVRSAIAHPVQPGWRDRENFTPFLWECKDYADDWIRYFREDEALAYQRDTDCLLRVTYRPAAPQPKGE